MCWLQPQVRLHPHHQHHVLNEHLWMQLPSRSMNLASSMKNSIGSASAGYDVHQKQLQKYQDGDTQE